MFDFDAGKLLIIGIVALVVIPPKDLPSVMRQAGQILGRMRRMAAEFQSQFMDAIREAELDEIRKDVSKLADSAKLAVDFDPVASVRNEIKGALGEGGLSAGAAGAGPIAAGSTIASPDPDGVLLPTDVKLPAVVAQDSVAAGIAPLAPAEGDEPSPAISHMPAESLAMASAVAQPSEVPACAAPEAEARRS
jgi:sec-independent protein translocase protein TatB